MATGPYAVFTEFSPKTLAMQGGWNTRVFTDTDMRLGHSIQCDFSTGIVTLVAGTYHISGYSLVAYDTGGEPGEMTTIRAPASAGYCRLRTHDPNARIDPESIGNEDPSIVSIGSGSTANMTPSLFEAYYSAEEKSQLILEHQAGRNPEEVYLRVYTENSRWHAMARICIRGIG